MTIHIDEVGPDDALLRPLIAQLRAELDARYPEEISFDHPVVKQEARFLLAVHSGALRSPGPEEREAISSNSDRWNAAAGPPPVRVRHG